MLDLNKNIINTEGVIIFDEYYLCYHERTDEYGIDYEILDSDLNEVDGGLLCYGDYNECTEMYDIDNGTEVLTLGELFGYIDMPDEINKHGIEIVNEDVKEMIMYRD